MKARDSAMDRRTTKKNRRDTCNSSNELQSNTSNQGRRKRSSANAVTGNSTNLGPDMSQNRRNTRALSPSPYDSKDNTSNTSSPRKSLDTEQSQRKRSSVPKAERKSSKEKSCEVDIEKSLIE